MKLKWIYSEESHLTEKVMHSKNISSPSIEIPDMLIVGATEDSFLKHFVEERSWYPVRINFRRIDSLKWIAVYVSRPVSAITHVSRIVRISPYLDTARYQVDFDDPEELACPVRLDPDSTSGFQGQRYSWIQRIRSAKFISDLKPWG